MTFPSFRIVPRALITAVALSGAIVGASEPAPRLAPQLSALAQTRPNDLVRVEVGFWTLKDARAARPSTLPAGARVIRAPRGNPNEPARLLVELRAAQVEALARRPDVQWIEPAPVLTRRNQTTSWVVQSNVTDVRSLWDRGLKGAGEIVGHIDGDIEIDACHFADSSVGNIPGPNHRKIEAYFGGRHPSDTAGTIHGTLTAGVVAAVRENDPDSLLARGIAPDARLVHSYDFDVAGFGNTPSTLYDDFVRNYEAGARIHTNSWGDDTVTAYSFWCVDIDRFTYEYEDALVIFATTNGSLLKSPENAKNCVAVGGSRQAPNQHLHFIGGQGPTIDGRLKPDVVAPAENIVSAGISTVSCATRTDSGTSAAAPAVAALAALMRQYLREGHYPTGAPEAADRYHPTGSLLKAMLVNSAQDLTGVAGYPGLREGWGRVQGDSALHFPGDTHRSVLWDVRHASGFDAATTRTFTVTVADPAEPLRITLTWADPAAAPNAAEPLLNDLDLVVTAPSASIYYGSHFVDGVSATGGTPNRLDTVEKVLIPSPEVGQWQIAVAAHQITSGPQGFALVATGALEDEGQTLETGTSSWVIH